MTEKARASDVQKQFGRWLERALQEPVAVHRHGRESVYLISAAEYHRLRRLEREALAAEEIPDDVADLLARAEYGV